MKKDNLKFKIVYWLYNHFLTLGRFKFVRKTLGGHWEYWLMLGDRGNGFVCGKIWFDRYLNNSDGGYTLEDLPILRTRMGVEDWN